MDYSDNENALRIARVLWWFYVSKVMEMLDSTMFLLRGKYNQLSFLHIYHHASMFGIWWIGISYVAGGVSVQPALINSSVHVIMYFYYFLAALGPHMQKYLWWKAHLTKIQGWKGTLGLFTLQISGLNKVVDCSEIDYYL